MIPHKTARGQEALENLEVYEGIPPLYTNKKRVVVPQALRVLRLKPGRKYTTVGRLANEVGWQYQDVVERLEERRKVKSAAYWSKKQALIEKTVAAEKSLEGSETSKALAAFGY